MDDIIQEFITETDEALAELDLDLVKLEQDPENQELLGKVFRLMHTIKGTCGFLGLPRLEKIAHVAENLLDNFRSGKMKINEKSMTLIFVSLDRVRLLVDDIKNNGKENEGDDSDIVDAINEEIDRMTNMDKVVSDKEATELDGLRRETELQMSECENYINEDTLQEPLTDTDQTNDTMTTKEEHKKTSTSIGKGPEYLRVQMNVLEDMINMVSELVLTRNQLLQQVRGDQNLELKLPFQRLNRIVSDLQDSVMKTRMQPISNAWAKLPRIVRDTSVDLEKIINLEMNGEETELDRQVLELIKDPLTHMIRNSCDHGIETPEIRLSKGKSKTGTIKLSAYHEGGFIIIKIEDDGKGLDPQKIAAKAVEKGLLNKDKVANLSDKEILSYIMRAGFSTAETISNVSGRGVGMDVVRNNIEHIGGSIDMQSIPDQGTTFTIQIPLTLAIISALIVRIEDYRYAIPQMNIQELVSLHRGNKDMIEYIDHKPVLRLRNRIIPLLDSSTLFQRERENKIQEDSEKLIVVMSTGTTHYGIIVDQIFDTEEVVIKSISSVLKNTRIFSGNTILGDGNVIMILDPGAIAREFNIEKEVGHLLSSNVQQHDMMDDEDQKISMLKFKAGKGALKAVPLELISRLQEFETNAITDSDGIYIVNFDNELIQLSLVDPKTQDIFSNNKALTLLLSDDTSSAMMGLAIDKIVDICDSSEDINVASARPGILGSIILKGDTVDILDVTHYIDSNASDWFSVKQHTQGPFVAARLNGSTKGEADQPSNGHSSKPKKIDGLSKLKVLIVDDSNFFRNMLKPVLTSAGYEVTLCDGALSALKLHDKGYMFDIILSDIEMPDMNGYEFVERMKSGSSWQNIPFIALTSHNTPEDIKYGYDKGFSQYIGKYDKNELIESISSVRN